MKHRPLTHVCQAFTTRSNSADLFSYTSHAWVCMSSMSHAPTTLRRCCSTPANCKKQRRCPNCIRVKKLIKLIFKYSKKWCPQILYQRLVSAASDWPAYVCNKHLLDPFAKMVRKRFWINSNFRFESSLPQHVIWRCKYHYLAKPEVTQLSCDLRNPCAPLQSLKEGFGGIDRTSDATEPSLQASCKRTICVSHSLGSLFGFLQSATSNNMLRLDDPSRQKVPT